MTEADRVLRAREAERLKSTQKEQATEDARAAQDDEALVAEVRALTADVLRRLANAEYNDERVKMEGIWIERERRFGRARRERVAAWRIGTHQFTAHGETGQGGIWLLSDGKFNLGGTYGGLAARTLDDSYLRQRLDPIRNGLLTLRSKLPD